MSAWSAVYQFLYVQTDRQTHRHTLKQYRLCPAAWLACSDSNRPI